MSDAGAEELAAVLRERNAVVQSGSLGRSTHMRPVVEIDVVVQLVDASGETIGALVPMDLLEHYRRLEDEHNIAEARRAQGSRPMMRMDITKLSDAEVDAALEISA